MATFNVPPQFEPRHCPSCGWPIEAVRCGRSREDGPVEPPPIEPCGHTFDSFTLRVGEVTYVRS